MLKMMMIAIASGAAGLWAIAPSRAEAAPAWCAGTPADSGSHANALAGLSAKDPVDVVRAFVRVTCLPNPSADSQRAEIEAARQAWGKRLGMTEGDWADAVAFHAANKRTDELTVATTALTQATPLDQYAVIRRAHEGAPEAYSKLDALYAADMFEPRLSETGRFGFLRTMCFDEGRGTGTGGLLGTEVHWAICQADFERFNQAVLFEELRGDTAHSGTMKMQVRFAVLELAKRIKDHAVEVEQMRKADSANGKLFEIAAGARAEWESEIGKNGALLELVLTMESGQLAQSRKLLDGCQDKTAAALAEAVSTIPAKAFAGMHDQRENPTAGFASSAAPVLAKSAAVNLAAIGYLACQSDSGTAELLKDALLNGPGLRGPRNAALSQIKISKLTYDKLDAVLSYPKIRRYGRSYPEGEVAVRSLGGVIKSIKHDGDSVVPELEKTVVKQVDCVASRSTGKVDRVRSDGTVEYQRVCDRSAVVAHDRTWMDIALSGKSAAWLKKGVVFSATGKDVIAVWPNKTAKAPSMVLGGVVK